MKPIRNVATLLQSLVSRHADLNIFNSLGSITTSSRDANERAKTGRVEQLVLPTDAKEREKEKKRQHLHGSRRQYITNKKKISLKNHSTVEQLKECNLIQLPTF